MPILVSFSGSYLHCVGRSAQRWSASTAQPSGPQTGRRGRGQLTLATASSWPETFRMRSGLPGILSETVTRALLFSCPRQLFSLCLCTAHSKALLRPAASRIFHCLDVPPPRSRSPRKGIGKKAQQETTNPNLIHMHPSAPDNDTRILRDDQAAQRNLLRFGGLGGWGCAVCGGSIGGCGGIGRGVATLSVSLLTMGFCQGAAARARSARCPRSFHCMTLAWLWRSPDRRPLQLVRLWLTICFGALAPECLMTVRFQGWIW